MPKKSRIDARPPHSPARSCPWPPRSAYPLEAYDEMEARQAGRHCGQARLPSPITAYTPNAGMRGNGGQVQGAIHHIIAGGLVQSIGKSVIGGKKIVKAKNVR